MLQPSKVRDGTRINLGKYIWRKYYMQQLYKAIDGTIIDCFSEFSLMSFLADEMTLGSNIMISCLYGYNHENPAIRRNLSRWLSERLSIIHHIHFICILQFRCNAGFKTVKKKFVVLFDFDLKAHFSSLMLGLFWCSNQDLTKNSSFIKASTQTGKRTICLRAASES